MRHEAMLWDALGDESGRVRCNLCAHRCVIPPGHLGACCVRENVAGRLTTLVYDRTIAQYVDPIEKKPLFHFYPGTTAFSIATPRRFEGLGRNSESCAMLRPHDRHART